MTVGIALVGAGHWGPNLLRNFHEHLESRVLWAVDTSPTRLAFVEQRYPDIQRSDRLQTALDDPRVGAVVIATPTATHFAMARAALEHGKHVLVEKPLTTRSQDGRALAELAAGKGLVLMVGHVFLYNAGIRRVRETIRAGDLGAIHYLSMIRTNLGPIRTDVSAAWDLASQDISIANFWLDSQPTAASAQGGIWINQGLYDAAFITLRYPRNVLVHIHVSWLHPRKAREITVVGERKMLMLDDMNLSEPLRIYDKRVADGSSFADSFVSFRASVLEGDVTIPRVPLSEPLKTECDHFLQCVQRGQAPLTDAAKAIDVVAVLEAIDRSLQDGGREQRV